MLHVFMASRGWKRKLEQGDIGAARKLTEQKTFLGKKHAGHLQDCLYVQHRGHSGLSWQGCSRRAGKQWDPSVF